MSKHVGTSSTLLRAMAGDVTDALDAPRMPRAGARARLDLCPWRLFTRKNCVAVAITYHTHHGNGCSAWAKCGFVQVGM
eukprot:6186294-Pleurochrysis_carterae.AAC.4